MGEQPPLRPETTPRPKRASKPIAQVIEENAPWKPCPWTPADAGALQALKRGDAQAHQQMRALDWIVRFAAGRPDRHYHPGPDGRRDTDFALGRAYVGEEIVKLLNVDIAALPKQEG